MPEFNNIESLNPSLVPIFFYCRYEGLPVRTIASDRRESSCTEPESRSMAWTLPETGPTAPDTPVHGFKASAKERL